MRCDQQRHRRRATRSDAQQPPHTPICYPTRYRQAGPIEPPSRQNRSPRARPCNSATAASRHDGRASRATFSQPLKRPSGHTRQILIRPDLPNSARYSRASLCKFSHKHSLSRGGHRICGYRRPDIVSAATARHITESVLFDCLTCVARFVVRRAGLPRGSAWGRSLAT